MDVRQTRELDAFSRAFSFSSECLASFPESQPDAFLLETSRPIRTSPVLLVLSEHLSSCNVFILFIVWLKFAVHERFTPGNFSKELCFLRCFLLPKSARMVEDCPFPSGSDLCHARRWLPAIREILQALSCQMV